MIACRYLLLLIIMVATPMKILIFDSQGLSYTFVCFHFISVLIKYALIYDEVSTLVQFLLVVYILQYMLTLIQDFLYIINVASLK